MSIVYSSECKSPSTSLEHYTLLHDRSSSNRIPGQTGKNELNSGKEEWRGENKPRREQTEQDVSCGTHHVKSVQAFPRFSYCKRQKLGVEAWERG